MIDQGLKDRIINMRKSGLTCAETARRLDIPAHKVEYVMKKSGIRLFNRTPKPAIPKIEDLVLEYDYVGFELTERDTIICTIGDFSGEEKKSLSAAIRSAWMEA